MQVTRIASCWLVEVMNHLHLGVYTAGEAIPITRHAPSECNSSKNDQNIPLNSSELVEL
jgi:hypothetical protein